MPMTGSSAWMLMKYIHRNMYGALDPRSWAFVEETLTVSFVSTAGLQEEWFRFD